MAEPCTGYIQQQRPPKQQRARTSNPSEAGREAPRAHMASRSVQSLARHRLQATRQISTEETPLVVLRRGKCAAQNRKSDEGVSESSAKLAKSVTLSMVGGNCTVKKIPAREVDQRLSHLDEVLVNIFEDSPPTCNHCWTGFSKTSSTNAISSDSNLPC